MSPATEARARQVGMKYVYQGHIEKIPILEEIASLSGMALEDMAYMGDDLTDIVVMRRVGLALAPANAREEVKRAAHFVTEARGGAGAVREVSQKIGLEVGADPGPGILHQVTGVIAEFHGNILSVEIVEEKSPETRTYFEIEMPGDPAKLLEGIRSLPVVHHVALVETMEKIYGKRIII